MSFKQKKWEYDFISKKNLLNKKIHVHLWPLVAAAKRLFLALNSGKTQSSLYIHTHLQETLSSSWSRVMERKNRSDMPGSPHLLVPDSKLMF